MNNIKAYIRRYHEHTGRLPSVVFLRMEFPQVPTERLKIELQTFKRMESA